MTIGASGTQDVLRSSKRKSIAQTQTPRLAFTCEGSHFSLLEQDSRRSFSLQLVPGNWTTEIQSQMSTFRKMQKIPRECHKP